MNKKFIILRFNFLIYFLLMWDKCFVLIQCCLYRKKIINCIFSKKEKNTSKFMFKFTWILQSKLILNHLIFNGCSLWDVWHYNDINEKQSCIDRCTKVDTKCPRLCMMFVRSRLISIAKQVFFFKIMTLSVSIFILY